MTSMPHKRVCLPVTSEQLREIAFRGLMADPLSPRGFKHQGSPNTTDTNGTTKRDVYEAICSRNENYFDNLTRSWNTDEWHDLLWSQRKYRITNKKVRPLDVPAEAARLYSMWVRYHLSQLVAESNFMEPTVVAFRDFAELRAFSGRAAGFTNQDAFASTVWQLVKKYGPWVVSLDQRDAFGNLPHKAIHEAFRELGLNHADRRRIVELVRIRTVRPNGKRLKPLRYGIEQGGPLSPLVFNIVMSMVVRRLRLHGVHTACFGDDIVLAAPTQKAAHEAFEAYQQVTQPMGYTNTRPIGTGDKATRIINTFIDTVDLIKTFKLGRGQIALTADKENELRERIPSSASLKMVRRMNHWKAVSKSYLRRLLPWSLSREEEKPLGNQPEVFAADLPTDSSRAELCPQPHGGIGGDMGTPDGPHVQDNQGASSRDVPLLDDNKEGVTSNRNQPPLGAPLTCVRSLAAMALESTMIPTGTGAGPIVTGGIPNGRGVVSRDGSGVGVQLGLNDGEGSGHRPSPSVTVLPVRAEDIGVLRQGRRLRVDNHYRGKVVDLRGIHDHLPTWRHRHSIQQLARVASVRGRAQFLIHPCDDWDDAFSSIHVMREVQRSDGVVMDVRQVGFDDSDGRKKRGNRMPPPTDVEVVVWCVRRSRANTRRWHVTLSEDSFRSTLSVEATCWEKTIGRLEALAGALLHRTGSTVAVRAERPIVQYLLKDITVRQVALLDAVTTLDRWRWEKIDDWLLGSPQ